MAQSEKESEGEKQTGREKGLGSKKREREYKKEAAKLNTADRISRLPVDPSVCRSYSATHLSLKEILSKLHVQVHFLLSAGLPTKYILENFVYFVESRVYCPYKNSVIEGRELVSRL